MRTTLAFVLTGLTATQVSATWNKDAKNFNSPQYNNNECTDKQKGGFNWGDVPTGGFSGYDGFTFGGGKSGGWTCANSFGKRDSLTKRTFNSKCVKNSVSKDTPAKMDCKTKKEGFSIQEIQVSVEFDCDLEFHYTMPDKSICKHTAPCKKDGTTVQNTQCGGAESVDVYLGNHNEQGKDSCEIGFHSIGFDCNPGYTATPKPSQPAETSKTTLATSEVKSTAKETPAISTAPAAAPSSFTTMTAYTNSTSAPVIDTPPASSAVVSSAAASSAAASSAAVSSAPASSAEASSAAAPSPSSGSTPSGGYSPPECLPKCMNTWLDLQTKCKDNTDSSCYCANPDFTKSVIECVAAWSTDADTQKALQYLLRICAPAIPQNPGLITNCPSSIPLNPTTPATSAGAAPAETTAAPAGSSAPAPPVSTITYSSTVVAPCGCAESTTITSTIQTTLTVPQVVFTTQTPTAPGETPSAPVQLVPGTPAPITANPTAPQAPYPTGSAAPLVSGTGSQPSAGLPTSTGLPEFTGAASPVKVPAGAVPAVLGAALAFFAL